MGSDQRGRLWSEYDSCLWHTCRIVAASMDGSLSQIPPATHESGSALRSGP